MYFSNGDTRSPLGIFPVCVTIAPTKCINVRLNFIVHFKMDTINIAFIHELR